MREDKSFSEMTVEEEEKAKKILYCEDCMFYRECAFPCKRVNV